MRLKKIRESRNLTQKDVSDALGIKLRTYQTWEQGYRDPTTDMRQELAAFFGVPEGELYDTYTPLEKLVGMDKVLSEPQSKYNKQDQIPVNQIPVISWVQATNFKEAIDLHPPGFAEEWVYTNRKGENLFALKVEGHCMLPEFRPGEIIIVDPNADTVSGNFVIIKDIEKNEVTFKQLKVYGRKTILHPLNPDYEDIELDHSKRYKIIGKVVEKVKKY